MVLSIVGVEHINGQRSGLPVPRETLIPEDGVEVEMLRFNRLPMIEIEINGKGPFRVVVDTGAAGVVLKKELAAELGLPAPPGMPEGQEIKVRAPGSDGLTATLHFIEELNVDAARIKGVWAIALEMPFGDGVDGVIGMDVFNDCLLTYDYPRNRIALHQGELPEVNGRDILAFSNPNMPNSHPQIDFSIDGEANSFMIDTGFRGWFAMGKEQIETMDVVDGPVEGEMGMSTAGPIPTQVARVSNSFTLGDIVVDYPTVRIIGGKLMKRVVGTLFLENFKLTFDAQNHRLQLEGPERDSLHPPALRSPGFGLIQRAGQMVVWFVNPGSDAAALGLKANDIVLEINGSPAKDVFGTLAWDQLIQSAESLTVGIEREGVESPMTLDIKVMNVISAGPAPAEKESRSSR